MKLIKLLLAVSLAVVSVNAMAIATVVGGTTCGAPDRTATMQHATSCAYDSGINFDATDVQAIYPVDPWASAGELTANGTNSYFTATSSVDGGAWGSIPNSGTYIISESFWAIFDEAVITMHIGQGNGDPDAWAWLITPDTLGGDWSLDFLATATSTSGGGLSNLKLWGREGTACDPTTEVCGNTVPEPGMVALLAIGLLGMVAARRRIKL